MWYRILSRNVWAGPHRTPAAAWKEWYEAADRHGCDREKSKPYLTCADSRDTDTWTPTGSTLDAYLPTATK